ncbi:MAG: YkgJ family cysteine cluster protein [Spirochaetes bacterium]|nr:YkgJ family cysteine cluster protein [Spirochaetota bacterium]
MQSCTCEACVSACKNDPGRLVPEDIPKLAEYLTIREEELLSKYLVKICLSKEHNIYALAPAKLKGRRFIAEPGTKAPDYYQKERGKCIFLGKDGLCDVHEAKPFECSAYMGCKNTFLGKPYRERQVEEFFLLRWKKKAEHDLIY